jgi:hypothetical protein
MPIKILALCGSSRRDSLNQKLLDIVALGGGRRRITWQVVFLHLGEGRPCRTVRLGPAARRDGSGGGRRQRSAVAAGRYL